MSRIVDSNHGTSEGCDIKEKTATINAPQQLSIERKLCKLLGYKEEDLLSRGGPIWLWLVVAFPCMWYIAGATVCARNLKIG